MWLSIFLNWPPLRRLRLSPLMQGRFRSSSKPLLGDECDLLLHMRIPSELLATSWALEYNPGHVEHFPQRIEVRQVSNLCF
jgi:hypothetical protein